MQLWDGAKDPEKQKVGRLGQKERKYAAFSAATTPQKIMKIVVDVQGKPVEDKSLEITSPPNLVPAYNNSVQVRAMFSNHYDKA